MFPRILLRFVVSVLSNPTLCIDYCQQHLEHKLRQEAEGELTIIKGIGNTSPEIKALQKELAQEKEDREYDKVVHAKELEKALQR